MNGAWIVSWKDTNTDRLDECVCSSLTVVAKVFPQLTTAMMQKARRDAYCIHTETPDTSGRALIVVRRVPMFRPSNVTL